MKITIPTPSELREILRYDPESGKLFWLPRPLGMFSSSDDSKTYAAYASWNNRWSGMEAFTADDGSGYRQGRIFGKAFRAHRVAWAITHGEWPSYEIDHINGDRSDNRINNLREASRMENARNRGANINSPSGLKGVSWSKSSGKWRARITAGGPENNLGFFDTAEDAHAAYCVAANKLHREFARTE